MKKLIIAAAFLAMSGAVAHAQTLKQAVTSKFLLGAAVNTDVVWERDARAALLVKDNFNSIVAENCMKGEIIHPEEHRYFWDDADRTVKFGQDNGMAVIGHCLVWHSQAPKRMFTDSLGKPVTC